MAKYILNLEEAMVGNFEPGRIKAYALVHEIFKK